MPEWLPERFTVRGRLGEGGLGVVYRAFDSQRDEEVALKLLRAEVGDHGVRLKREFRALAEIQHPNLVRLFDLEVSPRGGFFTMALVKGQNPLSYCRSPASPHVSASPHAFAETVDYDGPGTTTPRHRTTVRLASEGSDGGDFDEARVRDVLRQLCAGVAAIHASGHLHRDLKCSNILVGPSGHVTVLDFGLALSIVEMGSAREGAVAGTPGYMAPEQAVGHLELTPAADWYAVGVILFELLTGRLPLGGAPRALPRNPGAGDGPRPRNIDSRVPADLDSLCAQLLAARPEDRPTRERLFEKLSLSADAVRDALRPLGNRPQVRADTQGARVCVGRDDELALLAQDFEDIVSGETVLRVVEAPAGSGKTTLVEAFLQRARAARPDAVVIRGQCRPKERISFRGFDSILDGLSEVWSGLDDDDAEGLMPRDGAALARVFPVMKRVPAVSARDVGPRGDEELLYAHALEAVRQVLHRLAQTRPVVLYVDDWQWADAESQRLLTVLLRGASPPPLFLILAQLPPAHDGEDEGSEDSLFRVVPGLVRRTVLGALAPEATRRLCLLTWPDIPSDRLKRIARESAGNPLFAIELVTYAQDRRTPADFASLREVVLANLDRCPLGVRRLATLVAQSPEPLEHGFLARALGLTLRDVFDCVDQARAARVLRFTPGSVDTMVEPFHHQVRQALCLSDADPSASHRRLALAHQDAAAALENEMGAESALLSALRLSALHFHAAGDVEHAVAGYTAAVELAQHHRDQVTTAELFGALSQLDPPRRAEHAWRRCECLALAGRDKLAAAEALPLWKTHAVGAEDQRTKLATWLFRAGDADAGYRIARPLLGRLGLSTTRSQLGAILRFAVRCLFVLYKTRKGLPKPSGPGFTHLEFGLLQAVQAYQNYAEGGRAADSFARFALLAIRSRDRSHVVESFSYLVSILASLGFPADSLRRLLREHSHTDRDRAFVYASEGYALFSAGQWRDSITAYDECLELLGSLDEVGHLSRTVEFFRQLGYHWLGDVSNEARWQWFRSARARGDTLGLSLCGWTISIEYFLSRDALDEARRELERTLRYWPDPLPPQPRFFACVARLIHSVYGCGDLDLQEQLVRDLHRNRFALGAGRIEQASVHMAIARGALDLVMRGRPKWRRMARKSSRILSRSPLPAVSAYSVYLFGVLSLLDGREQEGIEQIAKGVDGLIAAETFGYGYAAMLGLAELTDDAAMRERSWEYAAKTGHVNWRRAAYTYAPMPATAGSRLAKTR